MQLGACPPQHLTDLLGPGPIRQVRLDLTTRCNLRCVYCAVSQPHYSGSDMPGELAHRAAELVAELTRYNPIRTIGVNGHGETTFIPGWEDQVAPLLNRGLPIGMTSNLAKKFSARELTVLSAFRNIAVSLDTADAALLRRMRRKVSLRHIVKNIELIRAAAQRLGRPPPAFTFLAGLYYPCAMSVVPLAELAVSLGVTQIGFWDLRRYDYVDNDLAADEQPTPLAELDDGVLQHCLDEIAAALRLLKSHGVQIDMHADFVAVLARGRGLSFAA